MATNDNHNTPPLPQGGVQRSHALSSGSLVTILGVVYVHRTTADGGDLYLTRFGSRVADLLDTANWYDPKWFRERRTRLEGTSAVYHLPTKEVDGVQLDLVVKNCRVGEDVPLETHTLIEFMNTEFNSPWEEFALVMELRDGAHGPPELRIQTQHPLAIYVPPEQLQIWQSGRSRDKINRIHARHPGLEIDILRQYKLVYGWIPGRDILELLSSLGISSDELAEHLENMTSKAIHDLERKGFVVADMKPAHVIISDENCQALDAIAASGTSDASHRQVDLLGDFVEQGEYSVVDYELLLRTKSYEEEVGNERRHRYLDDERDRMIATPLPQHLHCVEIMGEPCVCGHVESTDGYLWVIGRNARLFDYFLPERWRRTPSWMLSRRSEVNYTFTKDHVHIVWKTSRVGERVSFAKSDPRVEFADGASYNSPFEEIALAEWLNAHGVSTVYMRAIYMTGSAKSEQSTDLDRYQTHDNIWTPQGDPVLREERNYVTLRGFFTGVDSWVAKAHGRLCKPVDLDAARRTKILTAAEVDGLYVRMRGRLSALGLVPSLLEPNDMIVAVNPGGDMLRTPEGDIDVRLSNFELLYPRTGTIAELVERS